MHARVCSFGARASPPLDLGLNLQQHELPEASIAGIPAKTYSEILGFGFLLGRLLWQRSYPLRAILRLGLALRRSLTLRIWLTISGRPLI